jgi:adenylate cyclase
MTTIIYQQERAVEENDLSLSLLDISRKHGIPHASACGGNARCSTCRVLVLDNPENLLPPTEAEARMAGLKGFEDNIRLACQTHLRGPVRIRRLVLDDSDVELAAVTNQRSTGKELTLAVLFSDIRNFTPFAESHLAYDVVHILNRYFHRMGSAILRYDGCLDKYIGDGIMALFGLDAAEPRVACEQAVRAALDMLEGLPELNRYLSANFDTSLEIGIGIHVGEVVVGEMGHPRRMQFTAIGDVVNVASRIESATKTFGVKLLISDDVLTHLPGKLRLGKECRTLLKGKSDDVLLHEVLGVTAAWEAELYQCDLLRQLRPELDKLIPRTEAALFLRLAFHDAMSFDPETGEGGPDGSLHFPEELARPEHAGLGRGIEVLAKLKARFAQVSWADLIVLAGAVAVRKCDGPEVPVHMGRKDAAAPGRVGYVPREDEDLAVLKRAFAVRGLGLRDFVALQGAHTLGKVRGVPFTEDLLTFSNSYYHRLLGDTPNDKLALLASDRAMLSDPECRALVEEYARDQAAFFRDFVRAYTKLTAVKV